MVPSGAILVPLRITVEISSDDNGRVAEPAAVFHEATEDLTDVIVRSLSPDRTSPDRKQIEIYCSMNPNGNHPFAEEFVLRLKRELLTTEDGHPLVQICTTEPKAGETVCVENIHRFLGAFLNDRDVRIKS